MSSDRPPAGVDFQVGFREPGRRSGLIVTWLVLVGGSIWLFVATPHDLATVLMLVGFVAATLVMLSWHTYRTIRPRVVRVDGSGVAIRFPEMTSRLGWHEIESVELETYPKPLSRLGRRLFGLGRDPDSQLIKLRLRRRYGLWRWLKVPFVSLPFARTVDVPVVDAAHFVAIATEHLASRR
jgi:hypothetical protein